MSRLEVKFVDQAEQVLDRRPLLGSKLRPAKAAHVGRDDVELSAEAVDLRAPHACVGHARV